MIPRNSSTLGLVLWGQVTLQLAGVVPELLSGTRHHRIIGSDIGLALAPPEYVNSGLLSAGDDKDEEE